MNRNIAIVSNLNPELLPEGEYWLVIGPQCWGKSRSLPCAIENAAANLSYGGGTFLAQVIPKGDLHIDDMDGSYRVEGWTEEQAERARKSSRIVAVTKTAITKWTREANEVLTKHRKQLDN